MGVDQTQLRLIRQVHGVAVAVARAGDPPAAGRPEADVIVSNDPDVAIGVRVADCAPVLIADRRLGVVAAAHAGWRGTVLGAAPKAVAALQEQFGSDPHDLIAAIGPCLGPCCGEVGPEVVDAFRSAGHSPDDVARWLEPGKGDRFVLDLTGANVDQLVAAGLRRDQVYQAGICTKSHSDVLHSYRADGPNAGRMAGVIRARREKNEGRRKKSECFLLSLLLPSFFFLLPCFGFVHSHVRQAIGLEFCSRRTCSKLTRPSCISSSRACAASG